jgi:hypothetical protein
MFTTSKTRELTREIEDLKAQLAALKQQGQQSAPAPAPRQAWGMGHENGKENRDAERLQLERERLAAESAHAKAHSERTYAGQVVQALILLNGAAALSVMILIFALAKEPHVNIVLTSLADTLSFFSHGAAFAILTAVFAYLSQASWGTATKAWDDTLRIFALALALGSLLMFVGGVSHAETAFNTLSNGAAAAFKAP